MCVCLWGGGGMRERERESVPMLQDSVFALLYTNSVTYVQDTSDCSDCSDFRNGLADADM